MKLLSGTNLCSQSLQVLRNLKVSTRYSDRNRLEGSLKDRINLLRRTINTEITITRPYLISLEELGDRLYEDSIAALKAEDMPFYVTYTKGHEQTQVIARHCYRCLPEVI